jgi:thiamine-phosphate pyrophosphorylase
MSTVRKEPRPSALQLCYITDRRQFPGSEGDQERRLLAKIRECAAASVEFVQLREKDLAAHALEALAHKAMAAIPAGSSTRLLVNSRIDVALACDAHGVHLPAGSLSAGEARVIWDRSGKTGAVIGVSVHSTDEAALAEANGADLALFGPVFEKDGKRNPPGLEQLRRACQRSHPAAVPMPVLALGGITLENAQLCWAAGAAGIAGIRLFQECDVAQVVSVLRALPF